MAPRLWGIVLLTCSVGSVSACGGDDDSTGGGAGQSSENNVRFAETCAAEAPCGGDPTGQWKLRSACVRPPDGGFQCADGLTQASGKITGTIEFSGGSYSMNLDADLRQCGWIDSGGDAAGAPCGGDPTGQWKLRSACVRPPDGGFQCAD